MHKAVEGTGEGPRTVGLHGQRQGESRFSEQRGSREEAGASSTAGVAEGGVAVGRELRALVEDSSVVVLGGE